MTLGGDLYDAQTAEGYGWIDLAIAPDELDEAVARHLSAADLLAAGGVAPTEAVVAAQQWSRAGNG